MNYDYTIWNGIVFVANSKNTQNEKKKNGNSISNVTMRVLDIHTANIVYTATAA